MPATLRVRTAPMPQWQTLTKMAAICVAILLLAVPAGLAQKKKEVSTRSVAGVVTNGEDKLVVGAVVQLTDTKTKQVRSFITQDHGDYYFHGLSTDIEYELVANYKGDTSKSRNLSVFDSRKDAVVNLKIEPKK